MEKKYIWGSSKAIQTQYGKILNISLKLSDMQAIVNDKWYCSMTVMKKKEVDQWWNTHYVVENTYKKETPAEQLKRVFDDWKTDIADVPR